MNPELKCTDCGTVILTRAEALKLTDCAILARCLEHRCTDSGGVT